MKIIITGALGYIGSECLVRFANRPDISVIAVDNNVNAISARGAYFMRFPNIQILNCDITDQHQVATLPSVDLIVHLAAKVGYTSSNEDPEATKKINVQGTVNVANLGSPVILFSTGSVYGKIGKFCNETVQPQPQTVYAETKLLSEMACANIDHVIFRPATAYGLGMKVRHDLLVHDLIQTIVKDHRVQVYQPSAMRSFYSVQKLAELVEFACDNFAQLKNQIYNVGCDSGNVTKQQLLDLIAESLNFDADIVAGQDADSRDYNVDYTKLASVWPSHSESFSRSIRSVIDYYRAWSSSNDKKL
jgi:nucleoside-diphosphate-sugar epimerase